MIRYLLSFLPIFLFIVFFSSKSSAQSCANYSVSRTTGTAYTSITGTGTSSFVWRNTSSNQNDDNRSFAVPIGFDYWYLGIRYTTLSASLNGTIDFSTSTLDGNSGGGAAYDPNYNNLFSSANGTHLALAPIYADLWTSGGGTTPIASCLLYKLSGTAPNRVFTAEWVNFDVYSSSSGSINFQVKIYETTGVIEFNYGTMTQGSVAYAYTLGINGSWTTGGPTAATLLTQQTANTTTFSSTAQNALVTIPATNSRITFTPPTPTAAPTAINFTAIAKTGMTLNWTDNASNEVGYAIYRSTDNVNFTFVTQLAANAVSTAISGLVANTTYYWKIYAVTEGKLSAELTGSQATLPPGTITAIASTAWNVNTTWDCTCIPSGGDNVVIPNTFNVTLVSDQACNDLTIGSGASGSLTIGNSLTARTLTINRNLTINNGGTLTTGATAATHLISITGNIVNNGTLNLAPTATRIANVTFNKNGSQTISGTGGTTRFNRMTLNMGTSSSNILDITASNFAIGNTNFLTLTNGTFKLSTATATLTPFTAATTIPLTSGIWMNNTGATMSTTGGTISLYGSIQATAGTLNIGSAVNNHLTSYGGTIIVDGGTINVRGCFNNGGLNILTSFTMSSGTFKVAVTAPTTAGEAPFKMDQTGSTFNLSGGTIIIGNPGAGNLGYLNTGGTIGSITGGTLQMGDAATGAGLTMQITTNLAIGNLVNSNGVAVTSQLLTYDLNVLNSVTINAGTLNSNTLNINFGGNWLDVGTFTPSTGTITLNGAGSQSITKTGGETFNNLVVSGSGTKLLGSAITTNSNLTINSTLDVSASNYGVTVKGNWTNTGTFISQSGT
ncbi:MAG TPA: fibronectin type III domain-containing protein, partial [Bacteroidia bacterium]|nr:fibronectin type III domain-containing protein [Bacteroidia bacterium]